MIISISGKIKSGKDTISEIIQGLVAWKLSPIKESYIENVMLSLENKTYNGDVSGFYIRKFADKLKDIVCILINCTREQLEDREFKEKELGPEWDKFIKLQTDTGKKIGNWFNSYEECSKTIKDSRKFMVGTFAMTPRLMLQLLGTECGREILHPNIWVNSLFVDYKGNRCENFGKCLCGSGEFSDGSKGLALCETEKPNWIITDNRFLNEIQAVKKYQGITIRVERDLKLRHGYDTLEDMQVKDPELYKVVTHPGETELDNYEEFDYIIYNNGSLEELIEQVKQILEKENLL